MRLYCLWEMQSLKENKFFFPLFLCFWLLRKGVMMEILSGYCYCIRIGPFYNILPVRLMHLNVLYLI